MTVRAWQALILLALVTCAVSLRAWSWWLARQRRRIDADIAEAKATAADLVAQVCETALRPECAPPVTAAMSAMIEEAIDRFAVRLEAEIRARGSWSVNVRDVADAVKATREAR